MVGLTSWHPPAMSVALSRPRIQVMSLKGLHATVKAMVHKALDSPIRHLAADTGNGGKQHGGGNDHVELSRMDIVL